MGRFAPSSLVLNVPITRTQAAATAVVHAARLRSAKASASGAQIAMAQLVIWNRAETGVRFCDHHPQYPRPSANAHTLSGNTASPPIHASARRVAECSWHGLAPRDVIAISISPSG